jgi:hypothetical protein
MVPDSTPKPSIAFVGTAPALATHGGGEGTSLGPIHGVATSAR